MAKTVKTANEPSFIFYKLLKIASFVYGAALFPKGAGKMQAGRTACGKAYHDPCFLAAASRSILPFFSGEQVGKVLI
jgi:hypothetical protein